MAPGPNTIALLARAGAGGIPGAGRLPFLPGGGGELPADLQRTLTDVRVDRDALAAYDRVCGLRLTEALGSTYPHVLAFPLHLALMTDGRFPFAPIGLVHLHNTITQRRPILAGETLALHVRAQGSEPHPRGQVFTIATEARVGEELVWSEESAMLRRGAGSGERPAREASPALEPTAVWSLPGDLGRRYAAVSGDHNPIHLHSLTAKAFGFPRAIAHGMWTAARCLAALDAHVPPAHVFEVRFRRPILLPGTVRFAWAADPDGRTAFTVSRGEERHLDGTLTERSTA
ncbi:MAG TPA: MaoC/PaaZ C-terminal domain-containing protein [Solirubrobacteraceae bacterium]|jgi:acyl dehydratase|nr:MaoC/PaaZ C-terminal domain-containing protein [Solirubrobacteraceae bacterium]